ncbi:MAG: NAD(P)/FAD-dependent oxidoreductase [Erysipelotrichaceae bacterium]|jgi:glycerol-3-phosphate dehydrogenase
MYDVIIIGAGVVGCSTAYWLSQYEMSIAILEKHNDVANATTKANSGCMHAGYDPEPGSLMAKYNVEGSIMAKELCKKLDVPYENCGSLVLAYNQQDMQTLQQLYHRGQKNGVKDLYILDEKQTRELEPLLNKKVVGSLYAKTGAIIDPWQYTIALAEIAVENGVVLKLGNEVQEIVKENGIFTITTNKNKYQCKYIINAAGVYADVVHEMIGEKEFTIIPVRGQYYLLDKNEGEKINRVLFQCPGKQGKGVAVCPTVHGNMIVGPDAETVEFENLATTAEALNYIKEKSVMTMDCINFKENIRNFAGIRARSDRGDFIIEESRSVENFYNLAGMASPALTAACAIGYHVIDWLNRKEKFVKKNSYQKTRKKIRFKDLSAEQKNELIARNPAYGRIVCRCEHVTEGEILDCFNSPIPPQSIDAIKRRTNAGMGRCQGGFCGERVAMILKEKLNIEFNEILLDKEGSNILMNKAKEGGY